MRAHHALLAVGAALVFGLFPAACSQSSAAATDIDGRVFFPQGHAPPVSSVQVTLTLEGGRQLRAYPKADMSWRLHGVPRGAHVLDTAALGFAMPSIRLDVRQDGTVEASYTEVPAETLPVPIHIRAVPVDYFEKVVPFNVVAWLKSPMGMMAGFMVFAIVIMPYLKVDPEEMKQVLEEQKQQKQGPPQPERVAAAAASPQRALPSGGAQQQRLRNRR